jgi:isopropylmalate/homocitrate/citramalate synthase
MTRRAGRSVSNDPGVAGLLEAKADAICFVAKSSEYQVRVLRSKPPMRKTLPRSATA